MYTVIRFCLSKKTPVLVALLLLLSLPVAAANLVDVRAGGPSYMNDTIYGFCRNTEFQVYIENDFVITGMSLGFKFWSYDDITWEWYDAGGYGPHGAVTIAPGSRFTAESFDMTSLLVTEQDVDGISPDTIMAGGVAMFNGIPTGPLEHMYSMNIMMLNEGNVTETFQICLDSTFVPPSGAFVFLDQGFPITPASLWPSGGECWPVNWPRCFPPQWDDALPSELIVDGCLQESITLSAYDIESDQIYFGYLDIIGGGGTVVLDDHGDGTCDVSYLPVPEDVGQEIIIPITIADYCFGYPCTATHDVYVTVTSVEPLSLDCGSLYANGATNNPITKSTICASGGACGGYVYSIVSGPGTIDPATGYYEWIPGPTDIGLFPVEIEVTDGHTTIPGSFSVDVADEACCPGDANFTGTVDVSDAVFLINHVFKGGRAPTVPNWADANADCGINVGDVVFLIAYIFTGGPPPTVGCVY
jgi:hypothetical protein